MIGRTVSAALFGLLLAAPLAAGPVVCVSTNLGGGGQDGAGPVAVDAEGNSFVAGETKSANFPVTAGAFQTTIDERYSEPDAFVTRLAPAPPSLYFYRLTGVSCSGTEGP